MERRAFIVAGVSALIGSAKGALAQNRRRTPGQILGPYYPVIRPVDQDTDLTRVKGRSERAFGQVLQLTGRVLNEAGRPVPHARIEVWQADARGRYQHPSDKTTGSPDSNFQGSGDFRADAEGWYRFTTVKPGAYLDDGAGGMRAPHIHFQVTGKLNRIVTQMYFQGEALNDTDRLLAFANTARSRLIADVDWSRPLGGVAVGNWDIVLRDG